MTITHCPGLRATLFRLAALLLPVLALPGCRDSTAPVSVAVVIVSPSSDTVIAGETLTLAVTVKDADLNALQGRRVTWSSSDPSVATVRDGVVTAVAAGGPITITATSEGKSASAMLTVIPPPVATVSVTPNIRSVIQGATVPFEAILRDARGRTLVGRAVTWSSSNEGVATVTPAGLVSGVALGGPVTITATSEGVASTAVVTVILEPVASLVVSAAVNTVPEGETVTLTVALRGTRGSTLAGRPVEWSSSNPAVATVTSAGVVTGVLAGPVTIRATSEGQWASIALTVIPPPVASVVIAPSSVSIAENRWLLLVATLRDARGNVLAGRSVQWSTSNPGIVNVDEDGYVIGIAAGGPVTITATSEGKSGTATVTVTRPAIASVIVAPNPASILPGMRLTLTATPVDGEGDALYGRIVTWLSSDPSVASLSGSFGSEGQFTGVSPGGPVTITATSEGVSGTASVTVLPPRRMAQLATGGAHSCGVASGGEAYCWGASYYGQIGDNSAANYEDVGSPSLVLGGLTFTMVTGGSVHSCGVTTVGDGYCWGSNSSGQLGIGSAAWSPTPSRVAGGLSFATLAAGGDHTCGLTSAQAAYCWGLNDDGELGDGTRTARTTPAPLAGGLVFTMLTAGMWHTCGLTSAGAAYCWGRNSAGQLGDSTLTTRPTPVLVSGGRTFVAIAAGEQHTCGITNAGALYCWGSNAYGQLGDDSRANRSTPVPVRGGQTFASVAAGAKHTCAATTAGAAYCWGANGSGQLGNGTTVASLSPAPVSRGLAFASLAAGFEHSCGRTTAGAAYCWGDNRAGQLGDNFGSTIRSTPVGVLGFTP